MSLNKIVSSIFKASAVIELKIFGKGDFWSLIISFLAVLGIYTIRQKFRYISLIEKKSLLHHISLIEKKSPFIMELILMKNINETLKKIKNVYDDGNSKR